MANSITGDFDVVAEFSTGAVNRVLAAMHQTERFLHSMSAHVDDNLHPNEPVGPTVVGVVDGFGDAIADPRHMGTPNPSPGGAAGNNPIVSRLGVVVNPGALVFAPPQIIPSHISGVVQMQFSPPTLADPQTPEAPLTVTTNVMVRFIPDKGSAPLAEYMRGDLAITAPINKVVSGGVRLLDIDFKADAAIINFTPSYTSAPLSEEDIAGINLCIQNGLRTAFLPSSVNLPAAIADVQMKTLPGAIAILLDLNDHTPQSTSASVTNVFLSSGDDFAFAAGIDYIRNALQAELGNFVGQTISLPPIPIDLLVTTIHISYEVTPTSISIDLQPNQGVLTIQGNAKQTSHKGYLPDTFTFTATVNFTLQVDGSTVDLVLGDANVDTSSFEINVLSGRIADNLKFSVDSALKAQGPNGLSAYDTIRQLFDANQNLGQFLNPQLNPSDGNPPTDPQQLFLLYNSVDIQPAGVVVHGSLMLFDWPAPYVEFEQIPANSGNRLGIVSPLYGPDYCALKTWIPGGTITQYEWSVQGQEQAYPFDVDPNRFVLLHSGPAVTDTSLSGLVPGYAPLCLTITGTRISNFGPIVDQPVSGSVCGYTKFNVGALAGVTSGLAKAPRLAVTRPGPSGEVVMTGHAAAEIDHTGITAPNLLVQFTDSRSLLNLRTLIEALKHSKRTDPTAIIAVVAPAELPKLRFTSGIVYSDDHEGWLTALGGKSPHDPLTLIVSPAGKIAWQYEGALQVEDLAAALAKYLVKRGPVRITVPSLSLRIGQPVPDCLLAVAPGRALTLRKLARQQPTELVFWNASAKTSIQAVRDLQTVVANSKAPLPFLVAVNVGDDPEVARAVAAENGITAMLATDPKREVAYAYGVELLPTRVSVNTSSTVTGIRYGYVAGEYSKGSMCEPAAA